MIDTRERLSRNSRQHMTELAAAIADEVGQPIAEADKDRVFEAFHTTKPGALGMGLAISRSVVEGYGGRLWLALNEGYGVTVLMTLPVR